MPCTVYKVILTASAERRTVGDSDLAVNCSERHSQLGSMDQAQAAIIQCTVYCKKQLHGI